MASNTDCPFRLRRRYGATREFMDRLSYTTIIEFAGPLHRVVAGRRRIGVAQLWIVRHRDTFMNNQVVLFHLREAKEELDRTIAEISREPDYGFEEFQVAMSHLYHHLNTAWNGRDQTDEQFKNCTDRDFARFRRFPADADFLLD